MFYQLLPHKLDVGKKPNIIAKIYLQKISFLF